MPNLNIPAFQPATDELFVYSPQVGTAPAGATTMAQIQTFMRNNSDVLKCLVQRLWQPQVQYAANQVVWSPNMGPNLWAKVKTAGTTLGTEPVWSELVGAEVNDGTVVYTMCEIVPTLPVTVGSINVNDDYLMTIIYTDEDQETVQLVKTINGITPTSGDVDINRKFYNSLAQLGLNYDTVTFDQIANTLPVNSTLTFYVDIVTSQPQYAPNLDIPVSGFIVVTKGDNNTVPIKFTLSPIDNATTYLGEYTTYNSYGFKGWQPIVLSVNGAKPNYTGNVTISGKAPLPISAAGVGRWYKLTGNGVLPAGGMWAYFGFYTDSSGDVSSGASTAGIAAGGTTVIGGNTSFRHGFAWRIS